MLASHPLLAYGPAISLIRRPPHESPLQELQGRRGEGQVEGGRTDYLSERISKEDPEPDAGQGESTPGLLSADCADKRRWGELQGRTVAQSIGGFRPLEVAIR